MITIVKNSRCLQYIFITIFVCLISCTKSNVSHCYPFFGTKDIVIKDVCFDGIGCTISTASTSIMTELMLDKTVEEAEEIIKNYLNMINMENYDEDILEEAVVFKNTGRQANRIKCATIGWNGMQELIDLSKK